MDDLTAFVTARLDEDEALAKRGEEVFAFGWPDYQTYDSPALDDAYKYLDRFGPARVLREVAAGRRILDLAYHASNLDMAVEKEYATAPRDAALDPWHGDLIRRALAAIWSDHPDYRQQWAPGA